MAQAAHHSVRSGGACRAAPARRGSAGVGGADRAGFHAAGSDTLAPEATNANGPHTPMHSWQLHRAGCKQRAPRTRHGDGPALAARRLLAAAAGLAALCREVVRPPLPHVHVTLVGHCASAVLACSRRDSPRTRVRSQQRGCGVNLESGTQRWHSSDGTACAGAGGSWRGVNACCRHVCVSRQWLAVRRQQSAYGRCTFKKKAIAACSAAGPGCSAHLLKRTPPACRPAPRRPPAQPGWGRRCASTAPRPCASARWCAPPPHRSPPPATRKRSSRGVVGCAAC